MIFVIPELDSLRRAQSGGCNPFKFDFDEFLASRNDSTLPVKTLAELIRSRRFHPSVEVRLTTAQAESLPPARNPGCASRDRFREGLRAAVLRAMDANRLDAFVYPTWSNPPRLIGDLNTPAYESREGVIQSFARTRSGRIRADYGERHDRAELLLIEELPRRGWRDAFRHLHGYQARDRSYMTSSRFISCMCSVRAVSVQPPAS